MKIQQKLRALGEIIDQAEEIVIITDTQGDILYSNNAYRKFISGEHENDHQTVTDHQPNNYDAELIEKHLRFIIPGVYNGNIDEIKTWIKGNKLDLKILITPLWDKKGSITNFLAIEKAIYHRSSETDTTQLINDGKAAQKNAYSSKRIIHAALLMNTRLLPKLSPPVSLENYMNSLIHSATAESGNPGNGNVYNFSKFEYIDFPSLMHNVIDLVKANYPDKLLTWDNINDGHIFCEPARVWILITKIFDQVMQSRLGKIKVHVTTEKLNHSYLPAHQSDVNFLALRIFITPESNLNRSSLIEFEDGKFNLIGELNFYLYGDQGSVYLKACKITSSVLASGAQEVTVSLIFPSYIKA